MLGFGRRGFLKGAMAAPVAIPMAARGAVNQAIAEANTIEWAGRGTQFVKDVAAEQAKAKLYEDTYGMVEKMGKKGKELALRDPRLRPMLEDHIREDIRRSRAWNGNTYQDPAIWERKALSPAAKRCYQFEQDVQRTVDNFLNGHNPHPAMHHDTDQVFGSLVDKILIEKFGFDWRAYLKGAGVGWHDDTEGQRANRVSGRPF